MSDSGGSTPLGMIVYSAVKPIFKIYFIISLGFYLAKRNILTITTCRDISDCIVTAIMPCLIFNNVVTNLKSSDIKDIGVIFFTGTLLFILGVALSLLNKIFTNSPKRWFGGLLSVGLFPNISDLPIAYLQTLSKGGSIFNEEEGNKGVAYVCIFLAAQVFFQFSLGLYRLIEWDFREELLQEEDTEKEIQSNPHENTAEHRGSPTQSKQETKEDPESIVSSFASGSSPVTDDPQNERPKGQHNASQYDSDGSYQHREFLRQHELQACNSITTSTATRSRPRRGSNGQASLVTTYHSLQLVPSRTSELRKQKSQDINDVIQEYSEYDSWKNTEIERSTSTIANGEEDDTSTADDIASIPKSKWAKTKGNLLIMLKNFAAPNSASLIISLAIAMSPPLKALFVQSHFNITPAPDKQPPLSFIMDIASYIGAASVPLGLLLLGATISRLQVKKMPKGFWKTAVAVTMSRLIILPIIGVGITTGFYKGGWYGEDKLIRFVSVLEFGLPSATALVYFTAFYTDPNSDDHLQMDCLAVCLIFQYSILFITLPFLVSFTLKVSLGF